MSEMRSLEAMRAARIGKQRFHKNIAFTGIVFNLTASALWGAYALDLIGTDTDNEALDTLSAGFAGVFLFIACALCIPYSYWSKQVKENS